LAHPLVLLGDVGQVEARFGPFRDSVNLVARWVHGFASNVPRAWKSFWAHPMVLLGDMCQVEARFHPFGDSVNLGARKVYGLRRMYHGHGNFSGTPDGTCR
jgi:hypothetical protein